MRFVPVKNTEQQSVLSMHRARQSFVKARTAQANQIRGLLAEFGITIPQGIGHIATALPEILEDGENELPGRFRLLLQRLTIVHKGNIMKFTEGGFRDWAYGLAQKEFGAELIDGGPWCKFKNPKTGKDIIVKDSIADAFLQQILLRPAEYSVIATLNLNGDYVSDALAAQVGGIGIAPGANLSDTVAMFEATHGTAPKYAGKDYVNPGSEILSAEMMLRHMGWTAAADLIISSMEKSIKSKKVTYDFARLMEGATQVSCSGFGQVMIDHM